MSSRQRIQEKVRPSDARARKQPTVKILRHARTRTHTITCLVRNFLTEQIFYYIQFPYSLCPKYLGLHNRNIKAGKRNHILEAVCQFTGVRGQQARDQRHSLGPKLRAELKIAFTMAVPYSASQDKNKIKFTCRDYSNSCRGGGNNGK